MSLMSGAEGDGRSVRGERSRTKILDAFLDHLLECERRPTVAQTASRAGVSERLVYHHFGDVDRLADAAGRRYLDGVLSRRPAVPVDGSAAQRLDRFVDGRCWLLEQLTPIRRAVEAGELLPVRPDLRRSLLDAGRREVAQVFEPELAPLGDAERIEVIAAIDVATTWTTWEHLRSSGVSQRAAKAVVRRLILGALAAASIPGDE